MASTPPFNVTCLTNPKMRRSSMADEEKLEVGRSATASRTGLLTMRLEKIAPLSDALLTVTEHEGG